MIWHYASVLGQGNLEIDLNYMYRQPFWDIEWKLPNLKMGNSTKISIVRGGGIFVPELMVSEAKFLFKV